LRNKLARFDNTAWKLAFNMDWAAYFARAVSYEYKMFMKSTTGVNTLKLFSWSVTLQQNKLKVFTFLKIINLRGANTLAYSRSPLTTKAKSFDASVPVLKFVIRPVSKKIFRRDPQTGLDRVLQRRQGKNILMPE
jgi:hypothetical protein